MRLPRDSEHEDCDQSLYFVAIGINHDMPDEQLPTTGGGLDDDDQLDVDYLSLTNGHAAADHSVTTVSGRPVSVSLIDRVLASPQQTYEQLLASFTYLTAGLYNSYQSALMWYACDVIRCAVANVFSLLTHHF